jgi:hypothetical protein
LEIVLSGDDFGADIAERYGWVFRAPDDGDLDSFVDALARGLSIRRLRESDVLVDLNVLQRLADHLHSILP